MRKLMMFSVIMALCAAGSVQAAFITWNDPSAPLNAYDAADETAWISQEGTLVSALNASGSANATVNYGGIDWFNTDVAEMSTGVTQNGVTMTSANASLALHEDFCGDNDALPPGPDLFYNAGLYYFTELTITGLKPGTEYLLQIMTVDDRGGAYRNLILGDGVLSQVDSLAAGTHGLSVIRTTPQGIGGVAIGTFTADSDTQTIDMYGNRNVDLTLNRSASTAQFNALQLRVLDTHKPIVYAGPDQVITLPDTVTLDAYIQDDGDPNGVLKYRWEVTSKPDGATCDVDPPGPFTITVEPGGDVEPNTPYPLAPEVTVDQAGVYELKLTARDEEQDTNDTVKVTVYPADYLGLVTHWKLDEGAGKVAEDAAGNFYVPNEETHEFDQLECPGDVINGYGGTEDPNWIDGPNWENSGLLIEPNDFEEAIELDSNIQQYIAISNLHYEGAGLEACTVTAWIKTSNSGDQIIASFDHTNYWRLEVNGTSGGEGQIGWRVMTSSGVVGISSARRVDDNAWHHVAGVFDNGTLSIYIDGTEDASTTGGSTFGSGNLRYGFVGVGSEAEEYDGAKGPLWYFHGGIDDVRIYNIALTPDDILDISRIENSPPVAYAGLDKRLIKDPDGDAIVLDDASVVDIPGNVDVEWTATGPGTVLFSGGPVNATAIFDGSSFGLYELTITATDQAEDEWESSDSLCIMYQAKSSYDLVALYTLDESIPNLTAADSSGNELHGTLSTLDETDPNVPEWRPAEGKIDGALWFENTDGGPNLDQYVDLSRVPGTDDLTAMFWMKTDTVDYMIPLDKYPDDASGTGWTIKLRNNGETWFVIGSDDDDEVLETNNDDYETGVWVHMAFTFDSTDGTAVVYVNGLEVASDTGWVDVSVNNIHVPLRMGLPVENAVTERFRGLLDQVRIYDRALGPVEVAQQAIADSLEIDGCQLSVPGSEIAGDISGPDGEPDCYVDLFDVAALARVWLECTDLNDPGCDGW